jgi:aminopeptidase N
MSAMDETNFAAEGYLPVKTLTPDSGGGIDVLVHEIAHQWWGLATMPVQDGISNWSAEGITCYSTYCFMKLYFGEEYAQEHYIKKWQQGWTTYNNAFYIQHPEYLAKLSTGDASNIMASFVNMRLYDTMSLMMLKGEEDLGGTDAFQKKLSELYMSHLGQPITFDDFLTVTGLTKEAIELA